MREVFTQGECSILILSGHHRGNQGWQWEKMANKPVHLPCGSTQWLGSCGSEWAPVDHCLLSGRWRCQLGQHERFSLTQGLRKVYGVPDSHFWNSVNSVLQKMVLFLFNYLLKCQYYSLKKICWQLLTLVLPGYFLNKWRIWKHLYIFFFFINFITSNSSSEAVHSVLREFF